MFDFGLNLRAKVFLGFTATLLLFGVATILTGIYFLDSLVIGEGMKRVASYENAAWNVYKAELDLVTNRIRLLARFPWLSAPGVDKDGKAPVELEKLRVENGLDYLGLADAYGRVRVRGRFPYATGDYVSTSQLIPRALKGELASGTVTLPARRLALEGSGLAEKAYIQIEETPRAKETPRAEVSAGLAMSAAAPIRGPDGSVVGVLYGGVLLNRNYDIVDRIRSTVFRDEKFKGRDVGTVTLFQWDVRIATNVKTSGGNRAIGTLVSSAVYDAVLENGQPFLGNAFVVSDWYLSAYEPIRNPDGEVVGILYVGELEAKYDAMRAGLITGFVALAGAGAFVVVLVSFFFSRYLARPLRRLAEAAQMVGQGNFEIQVPPIHSRDEIARLTNAFNTMVGELSDRGSRLVEAYKTQKDSNRELQTMNRNYLDLLGFVSHEMRSPLAAALMAASAFEQAAVERLSDKERHILSRIKANLRYVVDMSSNYLNLSRIERQELSYQPRVVNVLAEVISGVLANASDLAREKKMEIVVNIPPDAAAYGDPNLLTIIYANLVTNAIKYGRDGGKIVLGYQAQGDRSRFNVYNEGIGIGEEEREHLFQRFSRLSSSMFTREKGTGLGLFITKTAVEKQGGTIWVEGDKNAYANFLFTIPVSKS